MSFIFKFTKKDFYFSLVTGCITGFSAWRIFEYLGFLRLGQIPVYDMGTVVSTRGGISWAWLMLIVPILWIVGVNLGYVLGKWFGFFDQFGKFAAIGFTNFAVTAGVLNILLSVTNYASGIGYSLISGASFVVGVLSSYIWNKYWSFWSDSNQGGGQEFIKFFAVTIVAFVINIAVASFVVNLVHPLAGMNAHQWANVGAVAGSAVALVFSFVGFKLAVFKK